MTGAENNKDEKPMQAIFIYLQFNLSLLYKYVGMCLQFATKASKAIILYEETIRKEKDL